MSALILRHNWTRQPQQAAVAREIAAELDVIGFFPGNGTLDLVGRRRITLAGNGKIGTLGQSRAIVGDTNAACGSFPLDLSALNAFSLSFYYLHPEVIGNDDLLFEHSSNTNNNPAAFFFNLKDSGNGGVCSLAMRSSAPVYNVKKFTPPSTGLHHVIVSFDGSTTDNTETFGLYIDGKPVALSATASSVVYTGNFRNDTLFLMSRNNASLFAGSALSAFTVYNRLVRDDSEAARIAANPWAILAPMQRRLWVVGETSSTVDNLTASDLVTGSPVLGTPTLGQVHALTATGITTSAPVLGTPAADQIHALTATALVAGSPVLDTPSLTENAQDVDALTAVDLVVGSPVLGTPVLGQIHVLGSDGLVTGSPVLGSPSITQIHTLEALGLTVGVPVLGTPVLNGVITDLQVRAELNTIGSNQHAAQSFGTFNAEFHSYGTTRIELICIANFEVNELGE